MQLVKYFASMSNDLKPDEIEMLKNKQIWPKKNLADNENVNPELRFIARDLYTPSTLHCEFGLPVISWNKGWDHNSPEGIYYYIWFIKVIYYIE